ncbi:enoyl-CoA hydratase/isomerase family protein [Limobrevibacterium gyesilva]|uniref:Enoyl-CoA hydratase-related protein n=1 Tax=Limobrevibacterium gyesilva TaxID=2991712 RepID=A0AA41YNE4_9PROT|nr:enoyl-CoA hydratase-related protein [Limobrevibacterium gyesilva]MCW3477104.1 enoyl-CoA hydratase-related protein [Limobrevibacterium gyesilva]
MSIRTEVNGHVLVVTIDRPEAMNAIDAPMNAALAAAWELFEAEAQLRVAVLTGAGTSAFSAGADLKTLIPGMRRAAEADASSAVWNFGGGLARGRSFDKPLVAAVNGHCLAGGLEMALACDIRLCAPNAMFGLAEVRWAIMPGAGGTQRLPRAIPASMAMEMLLTGTPIDAETALRLGLVSRIVPQGELLGAALTLAGTIAAQGPLATQAIKRAVRHGIDHGFAAGMAAEHAEFLQLIRTEDAREGPLAFAEKRAPIFRGR